TITSASLLMLTTITTSIRSPYTTLFRSYNIMGYNTPDRTDFGKVENAKDVILATDKAESGENGMLNPGDFDKDVDYDPEIDPDRSEEHTSELQSRFDIVCRLLLEKKKRK